jgi:murein DD-endopeptidase MepM/ murein hydrolase activator NlpD
VAADRREAAAALRITRALEQQARRHAAEVRVLLQRRQAERRAAAKEVAADRARYRALARERASVEHRIAVRIAKARAAARRAAARAAAARRAAAAERAAEKARRAGAGRSGGHSGGSSSGGSSSGGAGTPAGMRAAAHGFSYPVNGPITSVFGRRFHPVLRVWKLHDGTDFGSGCGTPIRAAYRGRVAERYYNGGYGNRLMIDHGYVDGRYVTTGYNHAIRYVVGVGQWVREGQVIGYVGSTGYSTGCHLHLMVWLNGRVANPLSWF